MSLERVELGNSNLVCRLILMSISACVTDYPKECVQNHVTSLRFWRENTDSVLEMVQDIQT